MKLLAEKCTESEAINKKISEISEKPSLDQVHKVLGCTDAEECMATMFQTLQYIELLQAQ